MHRTCNCSSSVFRKRLVTSMHDWCASQCLHLGCNRWWRDLLGLLKHMRAEGRKLPRAALEVNEDGFSFFGAWMIGGETVARILAPVQGASNTFSCGPGSVLLLLVKC